MASSPHPALYGVPAEVIRDLCGVTLRQAKAYKSGRAAPHPAVLKLVTLYREGRLLDHAVWAGWRAQGAELFNPEGHRYSQGMLRAYSFVWQLARELARGDAVATEALDNLASLAVARLERQRRRKLSARELERREKMARIDEECVREDAAVRARQAARSRLG